MNILSDVSETALVTLKARVVEAKKEKPIIQDGMGVELLDSIGEHLSPEAKRRIIDRDLSSTLTRHIALRACKYDSYAREFITKNPTGIVISLGCGFDTRYWRVSEKAWSYIEIDLPELIEMKKSLLGQNLDYRMIGCSVLEQGWLDEIESIQNETLLFLAEGLLMYLPKLEVIQIFAQLSRRFSNSSIVFEVVHDRYTRGLWKKVVERKMRRSLGTDAGTSYQFGVREAQEVEDYGQQIKVIEEWSYLDDPNIGFLRLFRNFKLISRVQWTIKAAIGGTDSSTV